MFFVYIFNDKSVVYNDQHPQGKLVRCISGAVYDVIVDLRKSSSSFGKWFGIKLSENNLQLWVPPGFAHGFYTLTETAEIVYKTTVIKTELRDRESTKKAK